MHDVDIDNGNAHNVGVFFKQTNELTFNPSIITVWNVNRTVKYVADPSDDLPFICLIRTISGNAVLKTKEKSFLLFPGSMLIVNYNDIKEYYPVNGSWGYSWYNFVCDEPIPYLKHNIIYDVPYNQNEEIKNGEIFHLLRMYSDINYSISNTLLKEIIYSYIKYLFVESRLENVQHYNEINEVLDFINNHIVQEISVKDLAEKCYLSERQFRNVFKKITGSSPKNYICNRRLEYAGWLLKTTNMSIVEISIDMHYSSPYQLSREFKKLFGVSPREYKKQN